MSGDAASLAEHWSEIIQAATACRTEQCSVSCREFIHTAEFMLASELFVPLEAFLVSSVVQESASGQQMFHRMP